VVRDHDLIRLLVAAKVDAVVFLNDDF